MATMATEGQEALTDAEREALITRLRKAWASLPAEVQAQLQPMLDEAHQQFAAYVQAGVPPQAKTHQTLRLKSYLTGELAETATAQGHAPAPHPSAVGAGPKLVLSVGPQGEVLGTGKYQQLDPRWELVAGSVWLENLLHKHAFPPGAPSILPVEDKVSLALFSDWGTGHFGTAEAPAVKIARFIPTLKPEYSVHLGDVYYAGTSDEEKNNLLALWPAGKQGSFALNSNHEMYSGGSPYFSETLADARFAHQHPWSFFALENKHWIVVGLDSAYNASVYELYLHGTLGSNSPQLAFLNAAALRGKKVILLTHHNPIAIEGPSGPGNPLALFADAISQFPEGAAPAFWYFGHEHVGAAYKAAGPTLFRCLGHGALPWGVASELKSSPEVEWFEQRLVDPASSPRVYNGWVHLELDGPNLTETYYDESGGVAWSAHHTA